MPFPTAPPSLSVTSTASPASNWPTTSTIPTGSSELPPSRSALAAPAPPAANRPTPATPPPGQRRVPPPARPPPRPRAAAEGPRRGLGVLQPQLKRGGAPRLRREARALVAPRQHAAERPGLEPAADH